MPKTIKANKYMKRKSIVTLCVAALFILLSNGCSPSADIAITSPEQALQKLSDGNDVYVNSKRNSADISQERRRDTSGNGQHPYAVIITCSDSRVPPEHIFSAGIGDLFVIRTAGNVIGDYELGSIEYGVLHLGAKVVLVMGHDECGAVSAAFESGHPEGHIADIVDEIGPIISDASGLSEAVDINISHSFNRVLESAIVFELIESGEVAVVQARYSLETGRVGFGNEARDEKYR